MGKKPRKLYSKKFHCALYCAAWPHADVAIIGGGGGKKGSGILNRIYLISTHGGQVGDEISELQTEADLPYKMALSPDKTVLIVALEPVGLLWINIEANGGLPKLTKRTGDIATKLKALGAIKCVNFSGDGRLIALGREDGTLQVFEWPSFVLKSTLWDKQDSKLSFRQLSFSAAHGYKLLATTDDDGQCILWHWEQRLQILTLTVKDAGLKSGRFNCTLFGDSVNRYMYTCANSEGHGYIVLWQQTDAGEIRFVKSRQVSREDPLVAFEVSHNGKYLAAGSSEGDVFILNSNLGVLRRVQGQHVFIVTSIQFSPDDTAVLSTSGDSTALVTAIKPASALSSTTLSLLAVILIALLAVLVKVLHLV